MTILLVDDDQDDIDIFCEVIKEINNNVNIITSQNGRQCLEALENAIPDVIFLDINMPIMNGKECLVNIKNHKTYKNIPVVMYSTTMDQIEIEYYKKLGVKFLIKPSSHQSFTNILRSIFQDLAVR